MNDTNYIILRTDWALFRQVYDQLRSQKMAPSTFCGEESNIQAYYEGGQFSSCHTDKPDKWKEGYTEITDHEWLRMKRLTTISYLPFL